MATVLATRQAEELRGLRPGSDTERKHSIPLWQVIDQSEKLRLRYKNEDVGPEKHSGGL